MSTYSETGHAKVVSGFETIVERCQEMGTAYNPTNARIQLPAITTTLADARAAFMAVNNARNTYNAVTNAREIAFSGIRALATRIVNALDASGVPPQTIDDARFLLAKLNGRRQNPRPKARTAAPVPGEIPTEGGPTRSVSQLSYDAKADHFSRLVLLVATEPAYTPNEPDLQVSSLQARVTDLQAASTAVIAAEGALQTARMQRDAAFYGALTGLTDLAKQVKKYVKSVFGASSPQYKNISSIHVS